ncbi:MAG: dihydrolipoyllysine-residue acetyltransferase [Congregibacter sp.]
MTQETVLVPDIGGSEAAEVVEVLVSVGDSVEVDQGLLVLESDKASMEIPSTFAGTVVEMLASEGDQLGEGAAVAVIQIAAGASDDDSPPASDKSAGTSETAITDETPAQTPAQTPAEPAAAADTQSASQSLDVPVPDIGTDDAVDLIELSVAVGDRVAEGDTLLVLESDKASMEVPSPASGVVEALHVAEGRQVKHGDLLLTLAVTSPAPADGLDAKTADTPSASSAPSSVALASPVAAAKPAAAPTANVVADTITEKGEDQVYAGPAVRMLAREFGVPLSAVKGSGPRGRVIKEDLHRYVQGALDDSSPAGATAGIPAIPEVDFAKFGPVDVTERSKIDKLTAANMQRSWLNVPHVTQFDDADITEMETFRKGLKSEAEARGTRLTPLPFLIKACAVAMQRHEKINSSLSDGGQTLTYKRFVHIGMAVDTPAGLVVPVIRDADRKTIWELAVEVLDLAARARDRKLKPTDMQGAGFTISSLGAIGGRGFTPIVNAPEVAILGVGRASTQPVWDGQAFQPRLQLPLSLSYDHRVVNGGDAGRFMTELCQLLGDIRKLLL